MGGLGGYSPPDEIKDGVCVTPRRLRHCVVRMSILVRVLKLLGSSVCVDRCRNKNDECLWPRRLNYTITLLKQIKS